MSMKVTHVNRQPSPSDLKGAKAVIRTAHGTIISSAGNFTGWWWHYGTTYVPGDEIYGPFKTERAARDNALSTPLQMMQ
jgi:hypothetical protein